MKTIIVSFSSRTDGNCEKIGNFIKDNIKDSILYSFSKFSIHGCGDCNYECFKNGEIKALSCQSDQNPAILFLSARKYGKSSIQGDLLTSEKVVSEIVEFIGK